MQDTTTPTKANAKLRSHGFVTIHSATIIRNRSIQAKQPFRLEVTGTWVPAGTLGPATEIKTKAVAAGTRQPLERFARVNNLPLQETPTPN